MRVIAMTVGCRGIGEGPGITSCAEVGEADLGMCNLHLQDGVNLMPDGVIPLEQQINTNGKL